MHDFRRVLAVSACDDARTDLFSDPLPDGGSCGKEGTNVGGMQPEIFNAATENPEFRRIARVGTGRYKFRVTSEWRAGMWGELKVKRIKKQEKARMTVLN